MAPVSSGIIKRDNLMRVFDSLKEERYIYVCAPAGFGKTVAIRQWLECVGGVKAVISLDEYDNSPAHFCERFCAALLACQPRNAALAEIVNHPAFGGAPDEFSLRAVAALSGKKKAVLVIDDLHFVRDEEVLRLLQVFLKRIPACFQIVLVSRDELPAGLSELWIKGELSRVAADQFAFSGGEIMALYRRRGNPITEEQAADIQRFTDGWAIGVNALLLSGGEPAGERLAFLDDFISANVWERWDDATRTFMLQTAVVPELTSSLCAALSGVSDCEGMLDRLVTRNAFLTREGDGAYRYHQLFQTFLRRKLQEQGDAFFRAQCEKAGYWYLSKNDFFNALDCFIQCESHDGIAQSFGLLVEEDQEYFLIGKMTSAAAATIIEKAAEKYPFIYGTLTWAAFNDGRADDMARYADLYYGNQQIIARLDPRMQYNIILLLLIDFRRNLRELLDAAAGILPTAEEVSAKGPIVEIVNQNLPLLHRGTRDFSDCAAGGIDANIASLSAVFGAAFGKNAPLLAGCMAAGLFYEQGQLEKAYGHALAAAAEVRDDTVPETKFFVMSLLLSIFDAMNQKAEVWRLVRQIEAMIEEERAYYLSRNFAAMKVRLRLGEGDISTANHWVLTHEPGESLRFHEMYETVTTCRAYIAKGEYNAAIILLKKTRRLAEVYRRPLDWIEADILLSMAFWKKKRGFQEEAMRHLEKAVSDAYAFGYTQLFVNEGAELSGMLRRLQRSMEQRGDEGRIPVSFVKMLYLKTLENQSNGLTSGQTAPPVKFTEKQRAVMRLLCEGKSYREISEAMGIKLPTLRSHIALIYKKLDVTGETEAVMKIKASDLLEEL